MTYGTQYEIGVFHVILSITSSKELERKWVQDIGVGLLICSGEDIPPGSTPRALNTFIGRRDKYAGTHFWGVSRQS
jgi:hypothetical protein